MATEILRPNGAGNETSIASQYPDSTYHWDKVDEVSPDEDTTYVYTSNNGYQQDLYALDNPSSYDPGDTITNVRVTARCKEITSGGKIKLSIRTNSTDYLGSEQVITDAYVDYTEDWSLNPNTGLTWTNLEIETLEAGVSVTNDDGNASHSTQVFVTLTYTEGTTTSTSTTSTSTTSTSTSTTSTSTTSTSTTSTTTSTTSISTTSTSTTSTSTTSTSTSTSTTSTTTSTSTTSTSTTSTTTSTSTTSTSTTSTSTTSTTTSTSTTSTTTSTTSTSTTSTSTSTTSTTSTSTTTTTLDINVDGQPIICTTVGLVPGQPINVKAFFFFADSDGDEVRVVDGLNKRQVWKTKIDDVSVTGHTDSLTFGGNIGCTFANGLYIRSISSGAALYIYTA